MVKRAYLDHALRFHPDRQTDRSEEARERAEFRMREINDAWSVLRNPATRARYDDELATTARVSGATIPSPGPSSARSSADRPGASASGVTATDARLGEVLREPQVADLDREDGRLATVRRPSRWRTWAPIIIGGVVLVSIVSFTAYAQDDEPAQRVRTVEEYGVGTCVVVAFSPELAPEAGGQARPVVVPVACSQPGARQVVARVPFPKPCPNGSRAELLAESKESLCLQ